MSEITEIIKEAFAACDLEEYTDKATLERFSALYSMLIEFNSHVNLTAITEAREVALLHFADCVKAAHLIPRGAKVIDVGCGGGFPTLPLAIVRHDISVTALDSTAKKLVFVERAAKELSLNVTTLPARAEEIASNENKSAVHREQYDIAISRAVAALNILSELCLPLVKVGGSFIAMKGSGGEDELEAARSGIIKLGGGEITPERFDLSRAGTRTLIAVKKAVRTPALFPRPFAKIKKLPL